MLHTGHKHYVPRVSHPLLPLIRLTMQDQPPTERHIMTHLTAKQDSFLRSLITEREDAGILTADDATALVSALQTLTKPAASTLIGRLKSMKVFPSDFQGDAGADHVMITKRDGRCSLCNYRTAAGVDHAFLLADKWSAVHAGECPAEDTSPVVDGLDLNALAAFMTPTSGGNLSATFAHPAHADGADSDQSRVKVRIRISPSGWVNVEDDAVYSDRQSYGAQPPGRSYRGDLENLLALIVASPLASLKAYAHLTSTCGLCSRPLEDEQSVERGMGAICYARLHQNQAE